MRQSIPQSIILSVSTFELQDWPLLQTLEPNASHINTHVDTMHIHPDPSIGIDQVREIKQFLQTKPLVNQKLVLVYQAHKMTIQAQNAALKILEEPPRFGYIVLITPNPLSLLATIRSRCVLLSAHSQDEIHTAHIDAITKLKISQKIEYADEFNKDIQSAKQFLEMLVNESRMVMLEKHTSQSLFNCVLALHGLKLLSVNTNPKLVIDYVLFRLKAV